MNKLTLNIAATLSTLSFFANSEAGLGSSKIYFPDQYDTNYDNCNREDSDPTSVDNTLNLDDFRQILASKKERQKMNERIESGRINDKIQEQKELESLEGVLIKITDKLNDFIEDEEAVRVSIKSYHEKGGLNQRFDPLVSRSITVGSFSDKFLKQLDNTYVYYKFLIPSRPDSINKPTHCYEMDKKRYCEDLSQIIEQRRELLNAINEQN